MQLAPAVERRVRIVVTGIRPAGRSGTVLVSRGRDGAPADAVPGAPLVSAGGDTVLYTSYATNLVKRRLAEQPHLFAWNAATRHTELVGISPEGRPVEAYWRDVSADGRRVLFRSSNGSLWLRDRDNRTTTDAPPGARLTDAGQLITYPDPPEGWSHSPAASPDGRFVVLERRAPSATDPYQDEVALRVMDSTTQQVVHERTLTEPEDTGMSFADLTADGRFLKVTYTYRDGSGNNVVDLADRLTRVDHAEDISDDGRWLLTSKGDCLGLDLTRWATGEATWLFDAGHGDFDYEECPLARTSLSRDGSAVAYDYHGEQLVPRVRSHTRQIYYWRLPVARDGRPHATALVLA